MSENKDTRVLETYPDNSEIKQEARENPARVIAQFNYLYHQYLKEQTWQQTHWLGVETLKAPTDLLVIQDIVWNHQPDYIIETGTYQGGSSHFFAEICDLIGNGEVLTIDINDSYDQLNHERVTRFIGDSTSQSMKNRVRARMETNQSVMVVLDSDHDYAHVRSELEQYAPLVTNDQYLVVEDTIHDIPSVGFRDRGPWTAVQEFLDTGLGDAFTVDRKQERFMLTFAPGGYLKRESGNMTNSNPD